MIGLFVCLSTYLSTGAASAGTDMFPRSPSERVQVFAMCAGRYSALEEHQRFFDGAASEQAGSIRAEFESLIDAAMPDAVDWGMPQRMALDWRVTAKAAQAQLLHSGTFATNSRRQQVDRQASESFFAE
ncbi:MAG: hypothetical protein AAFO58_04885, partial [Pseudomonadota bacterium]